MDHENYVPRYGLHYCKYYQNIVKFNPEFCGKCPYNGLKPTKKESLESETGF
jgi:hypothetical protein